MIWQLKGMLEGTDVCNSNVPSCRNSIFIGNLLRRRLLGMQSRSLKSCSRTDRLSMPYWLLYTFRVLQVGLLNSLHGSSLTQIADFLLALCPPNINPSSLTIMVAFAVGGLLGDTLFHLLPEIFLGEAQGDHARFVLVDPNKNVLLGVAILVGFVTFVAMDKTLRIATGGDGGHDHSHGLKKEEKPSSRSETPTAVASGVQKYSPNGSIKARKSVAGKLMVSSDTGALTLHGPTLKKLRSMEETRRANRWLEEVLEEDPSHGVTQIAIWKAYEAAFRDATAPLLEATVLIHGASRVFENASAQIIDEPQKKFIIKGVRPRERKDKEKEKETKSDAASDKAIPRSPSVPAVAPSKSEPSQSIKLSAYLNLIADFTHNITDGLALSSSFYASPALGATTCVAVFFHEIPHEVGDFALLIQSGFSKRKAMAAQFVTALGAFLGTCLGIAVQEMGKAEKSQGQDLNTAFWQVGEKGLAGTGLGWEDMLLPFTAGTFLYVGTVAVIPELLETQKGAKGEAKKTVGQFLAMALGAGIMLW